MGNNRINDSTASSSEQHYERNTTKSVVEEQRRLKQKQQSPMDTSMSLTDLLEEMEKERDATNATECDLLSESSSFGSSFALDDLVIEADNEIGSTIRTENLPTDWIGSSIQRANLPQESFGHLTFKNNFHKDSFVNSKTSQSKSPKQLRKKTVRFESISKLTNLV